MASPTISTLATLAETASQALAAANEGFLPPANATVPMAEGFGWGGYFQAVGAVFLILAALVVGFWMLRRFGPKAGLRAFGRGDLKLEGQLSLGPKRNVVVVRFLNKRLVLGVTESRINLLTEMETGNDERTDFARTLEKEGSPRGGS